MPDLERRLYAVLSEGRGTWPGVMVEPVELIRFVATRLPEDREADEALTAVRAGDLYLTCACVAGAPNALAAFDKRFMREIDFALGRMRVSAQEIDDIKQMVRQKLFVGEKSRAGRIADYSGRGDLRRWVRSIAVRTCLNQMRKGGREMLQGDDKVFDGVAPGDDDPELAYMKERYRSEFRAAFLEALRSLSAREQNLLRYHHVDGLNIDEIGAIYRVHRVTAYRWLEKARDALVTQTHKLLRTQLQVEKNEFESILRMIRSQFHVSLVRYLGAAGGGEGSAAGAAGPEARDEATGGASDEATGGANRPAARNAGYDKRGKDS